MNIKQAVLIVSLSALTFLASSAYAVEFESRYLDTQVVNPSAAQLGQIASGAYSSIESNRCPTQPDCGNPNQPKTGVTCPDLCFVEAGKYPHVYPKCPVDYAKVADGPSDFVYEYQGPVPLVIPSNEATLIQLQNRGYSCGPDTSQPEVKLCPVHTVLATDTLTTSGGRIGYITRNDCTVTGAQACNWHVSCGVSHTKRAFFRPAICSRGHGYYPKETGRRVGPQANPEYLRAPTSIICGHVNTKWVTTEEEAAAPAPAPVAAPAPAYVPPPTQYQPVTREMILR